MNKGLLSRLEDASGHINTLAGESGWNIADEAITALEQMIELLWLAWANNEGPECCHSIGVNKILLEFEKISQEEHDRYVN